jgi:putative ABC transport system permease protein
MLTLTLRGLRAHKRRLLSTATAVLLGVAFMAGSLIFTDTMKASLSTVFANAEQGTDALVRGPATLDAGYGEEHAPVAASLVDRIAAVDGVAAVAPRIEGFAQVVGRDGKPLDSLNGGATPAGAAWSESRSLNPFHLVAGRGPTSDDQVVIDRSTATAAHLSVGDTTSVLTRSAPTTMTVSGIATFAGQDNRAGNHTVLFTPAAAQRLLGRDGTVDSIAVGAAAGVSEAELVRRIDAVLPAKDQAITGTALTEENRNRKNTDVDFFALFMKIFAAVALLVGAFIINNTFAILVAQRTKELALLRAVGASARQVRRSVTLEAVIVGALASGIGLLGGVGVATGIQKLWRTFGITLPAGDLVVKPGSLVIAFAVGLVVTVVSALLPARRAARVAPVAAMRSVAVDRTGTGRVRIGIGLTLTAVSVAAVVVGFNAEQVPAVLLGALGSFLGVATLAPVLARPVVRAIGAVLPMTTGMRGVLARENAMRNPRRTAATASALMIGVALVGGITVFASSGKWSVTHSFDKEFRGDLVVDTHAWVYGGVSPELASDLSDQPGVRASVAKQYTLAKVGDGVSELGGWPSADVEKVFDLGVSAGSLQAMGDNGLAVASSYASSHDWRIGHTVPVTFADGAQKTFVVRALFDHPDWTGKLWIDRSAFQAAQPDALDVSVYVTGGQHVPAPVLRADVDAVAKAYSNAEVLDRAAMRKAVTGDFNAMLGIVYALLALAIVIALLGIANTVSLSVIERTRELGLLRAVGMSRGHLRGMVRWEAALVAVFGTLTGLGVGLFLGWALVFAVKQSGVETARTVVPVGQLLVIVAIAAVCGVVAALLPARRAARLDVLEAISTT